MIIIDRFEGDFAVCETDGEILNIRRVLIEKGAKEGDVLIKTLSGLYAVDKDETDARRNEIINLQNSLWE